MRPEGTGSPSTASTRVSPRSESRAASVDASRPSRPSRPPSPAQDPQGRMDALERTETGRTSSSAQSSAPSWADPAYFQKVAARAAPARASGVRALPVGGTGLSVRAQALEAARAARPSPVDVEERRATGRSLLARAGRALGVIGGVPMSPEDIARTQTAVHLTRPAAVEPILAEGLKPTVGLYKNLTSWCRDAVYMFPRPPSALQRAVNFADQMNAATEVIEVDLTRLDPERLYRRVLDGALLYISDDPIPPEAIRHRGSLSSLDAGQQ